MLSGAAPAWAGDAATPTETGAGELEQIVVTAEKRVSTVLQTPISITAVSGDELLQRGISSLSDLALETPGISMKQFHRTFLFAHNLTDKIAVLTASTMTWIGPLPPIYRPAVTTPRTVGVEVNYAFGR